MANTQKVLLLAAALAGAAGCAMHVESQLVADEDVAQLRCVAVVPFESHTGQQAPGDVVAEMLSSALVVSNRYNLIEPREVRALLEGYGMSFRAADNSSASHLFGEALGVDAVLSGSVESYDSGTGIAFSSRLLDVNSGREIWHGNVRYHREPGASQPALVRITERAVDALVADLVAARDTPVAHFSACAHPNKELAKRRDNHTLVASLVQPSTRPEEPAGPTPPKAASLRQPTQLADATAVATHGGFAQKVTTAKTTRPTPAAELPQLPALPAVPAGDERPARPSTPPADELPALPSTPPADELPALPSTPPADELPALPSTPSADELPALPSTPPENELPALPPTPPANELPPVPASPASSAGESPVPDESLPALPALDGLPALPEVTKDAPPATDTPPVPPLPNTAAEAEQPADETSPTLSALPPLPDNDGEPEASLPGDDDKGPELAPLAATPQSTTTTTNDEYAGLPYAPAAPEHVPRVRGKLAGRQRALLKQLFGGTSTIRRLFRGKTTAFTPMGRRVLADAARLMQLLGDLKIAFEVHVDAGNPARSLSLSEKQLAALEAYMNKKFPHTRGRFFVRALGSKQPLAKDINARARAQNTRVELRRVY